MLNNGLAGTIDPADEQCDSDEDYWQRHQRIALQTLCSALKGLSEVIDRANSESLVEITNQAVPMIATFNRNTSDRIYQLNIRPR